MGSMGDRKLSSQRQHLANDASIAYCVYLLHLGRMLTHYSSDASKSRWVFCKHERHISQQRDSSRHISLAVRYQYSSSLPFMRGLTNRGVPASDTTRYAHWRCRCWRSRARAPPCFSCPTPCARPCSLDSCHSTSRSNPRKSTSLAEPTNITASCTSEPRRATCNQTAPVNRRN